MVKIKTTLNLVISSIAIISLLPVVSFINPWLFWAAIGGVLGGAWCDHRERYIISPQLATLISMSGVAFYLFQVSRIDMAGPMTHAMILLLIVRLLTPKEPRNYLQIFALGLFILASSSLTSLDLGLGVDFLTYLVLMVSGVTFGLVLLTVYVTDQRLILVRPEFYHYLKVSVLMTTVSVFLMLVLFFILPRARLPIWNFLNPGGVASVGLAESVQPGAYAELSAVENLAFRAEVEELPQRHLYWRALVLNQPEGKKWVRVPPPKESISVINSSRAVNLSIYPELRNDRYLVNLEHPAMVSNIRYRRSTDLVFTTRGKLNQPYRIDQLSHLGADIKTTAGINRDFYLSIPAQVSQRMKLVVENIIDTTSSGEERFKALADFFQNQQLQYAQTDLPNGLDPIDEFLFEKKRGYCEFFASAYIVLARMLDIPARLVGGYYGGDYNPVGGYYLVSEDSAHVWVEVLTQNNLWVRVDPSQWAINASSALNNRIDSQWSVFDQLMDSVNHRWVKAVVLFDFYNQRQLFRETREKFINLNLKDIAAKYGLGVFVLIFVTIAGIGLFRCNRRSQETRLLKAFKARVCKRYGEKAFSSSFGLSEIGERLDDDHCREFARLYHKAVFMDRRLQPSEVAHLNKILQKI